MHRHVNILQYVKMPSGRWQWEPLPRNRRSGSYVWAKAKSNHFYLVWREQNRRHYQKAGSTPAAAMEAQKRKEFELAGRAVLARGGKISKPKSEASLTIEAAVADYLDFIKKKKRPNTLKRYRAVLNHFRAFFKPYTHLSAIEPSDIDAFRDERLSQKNPWGKKITQANVNSEVAMIRAFYYYMQKFRDPSLPNPAARLKPLAVTRAIVDTYEEREIEKFFETCTADEIAIFKTFYYTGLREQELAHLHWADLNLAKGILSVRAKPEEGFIPKGWEERKVPLHPELVAILKELPRRHETFVFPSFKGNPNGHLLRMLKDVVGRAGLPGRWYLHKFRKTFATRALEKGADIRTVQALLGHM